MSEAVPVTPERLDRVTPTRRLAIRELRLKGGRTRAVEHFAESGINGSMEVQDSPSHTHDTFAYFSTISNMFFQTRHQCCMWKRDASRAFRRLPICVDHFEIAWVVWLCRGQSNMAQQVLVQASSACGSADDSSCMVVLGPQVSVVFEPQPKETMKVDRAKAEKWANSLCDHLASRYIPPADAVKFAGKLSFAVILQANKVGRAFVKPFFAQFHDPLHGNAISALLEQAIHWWLKYLELRPPAMQKLLQSTRPQTVRLSCGQMLRVKAGLGAVL
eukprot:1577768-Amphidinium_carterae.1